MLSCPMNSPHGVAPGLARWLWTVCASVAAGRFGGVVDRVCGLTSRLRLEDLVTVVLESKSSVVLAVPQVFVGSALAWVESAALRERVPGRFSGIHLRWGDGTGVHPPFYGPCWEQCEVSGPALTMAATDRYRLMVATVRLGSEYAGMPSGCVDLHRPDLLAVVKGWPKPVHADARVTFRAGDGQVQVSTATTTHMLTAMVGHEFPQIGRLLPDVTVGDERARYVQFNAGFLRDIADAARKIDPGDPLVDLAPGDQDRAVVFRTRPTGDDQVVYRGLLMPVKNPA